MGRRRILPIWVICFLALLLLTMWFWTLENQALKAQENPRSFVTGWAYIDLNRNGIWDLMEPLEDDLGFNIYVNGIRIGQNAVGVSGRFGVEVPRGKWVVFYVRDEKRGMTCYSMVETATQDVWMNLPCLRDQSGTVLRFPRIHQGSAPTYPLPIPRR